jgi:hypothetical protein
MYRRRSGLMVSTIMYYAVFEMTGRAGMTTRSATGHYSSIDEVIRPVESTLNGKVTWDET